jgi:hypothetical protein
VTLCLLYRRWRLQGRQEQMILSSSKARELLGAWRPPVCVLRRLMRPRQCAMDRP